MGTVMWAIILCGLLSIVYGAYTVRAVMAADAGTPRMQEIAAAIQEGAQAYLTRQYTTIAIAGAVIFVIVGVLLGWLVAIGFLIGAVLSGAAGFIGMLVSVRANVRTAQAATRSLAEGLSMAFRAGAVTGLLVAGLALLGVAVYFAILTDGLRLRADQPHGRRLAGGARLRRLADLDLRPSRRRHLHQGRRRRRRPRRQGRGRHPRGRSAQPRHHRRQRRRQRRRLRRHGGRPVRDLRRDRGRHHGAGGDLLRRPAGGLQPDALSARGLRRRRGRPRSSAPSSCGSAPTSRSWARSTRASSPPACSRSSRCGRSPTTCSAWARRSPRAASASPAWTCSGAASSASR